MVETGLQANARFRGEQGKKQCRRRLWGIQYQKLESMRSRQSNGVNKRLIDVSYIATALDRHGLVDVTSTTAHLAAHHRFRAFAAANDLQLTVHEIAGKCAPD